ncbi:MmgE/PrpD family protein [Roseinatronobacter sp.]
MNIEQQFAQTYADLPEVPQVARKAAQIALADALSVMVAATTLEPATRKFAQYAINMGGVGCATLIGHRARVPVPFAALANGALAHAVDFEDTFEPGFIHPNASLVPAVLALAQAEPVTGPEILDALAIGCDFACRLSLALADDPAKRGWYHPPILSGLGATLGCARLLGLSARQMTDAMGLFTAQFMLGDELKRSPESDLRAVREGFAARAAVESALLARENLRAVDAPLTGRAGIFMQLTGAPADTDILSSGLGQRFLGPDVALKRWPACRGTHAAIIAASALQDRIDPASVSRVLVSLRPPADMLFEPKAQRIAPSKPIDARFSIPFVFASTLIDGPPGLASFSQTHLTRTDLRALAKRVVLDTVDPNGPEARFVIEMQDRTTIIETVEQVAPWRTDDITIDALREKTTDCLRFSSHAVAPEDFLRAINQIELAGIEPIMALL